MENASKALLIAASLLIGILIMTVVVYIFSSFSTYSKNTMEQLSSNQISEFNSEFTKYEAMESVNIYQIISVSNYAKNYNDSLTESDKGSLSIQVFLNNDNNDIVNENVKSKNNLIKNNTENRYKVSKIEYNNVTKLVKTIKFKEI